MTKIFVANRSYHDYSDAERFGELIYLTDGSLRSFSVSQMFRVVEDHLIDSSQEDIILISGLSVFNSLLCGYFSYAHGRLNMLIYKRKKSGPGHYEYKEVLMPQVWVALERKGDDLVEGQKHESGTDTGEDGGGSS